ncbi:hypothetical protein [Neobacillus niacini]|uniref:hypothetical protein n=1 Tax=Neobacillus niacini TaxID=86668 RepID=UPI0021CAE9A3|nr:hypothetical protein [Neobacillus niacini]MCM3764384.1 hypothetical protein [Neobacillus niacini]
MDIAHLEKMIEAIKVERTTGADVNVVNDSQLNMLGKGPLGAVFHYRDGICVKVFANEEDCQRVYNALSVGEDTNLLPKIYAKGKLYIAMEHMQKVDLKKYLGIQPFSSEISKILNGILEGKISRIRVQNLINADVDVVNLSGMKMIGKGRQGAVFQYSDGICVKVFGNVEDCEREYYALSLGQHTNLFPIVYVKGNNYIAMEIIKGVDLREYLQSQPLTPELSQKLIEMLIIFKEIGYERIDHHKRQIYLQSDGSLKVIDVARTVWRDRVYPYPRKLLTSLGEENKAVFLSHVQATAPQVYEEWLHYIRMEELSRQIYGVLIENPDQYKKLNTNTLQTRDDEQNYVNLLAGLMHKVFKEEWVKTMLARGSDPEVVMGKIDKFLEKRGQGEKIDLDFGKWQDYGRKQDEKRDNDKDKDKDKNKDKDKDRSKKQSRSRSYEGHREHNRHNRDHHHEKGKEKRQKRYGGHRKH